MDPDGANRIADEITEKRIFIFRRLDLLPFLRIDRGKDQRAVQREGKGRGEEKGHRDHVRRIIVEIHILISGVGYPVEMAENTVGKAIAPCTEQERAEYDQRHIGQNGKAEGDRNVIAHAELPADFDFAQGPGNEGSRRAHGDDLPETALLERRQRQAIFHVRRIDRYEPGVPGRPERCRIEDQRRAQNCAYRRYQPEEADIERPNPEIEQIPANKRPSPDTIFSFKA